MNLLGPNINANSTLLSRNEGKIKSHGSCSDLRAWSHDQSARDRHLREWMKRDMTKCVLPVCALASLLRTMTCRSQGRATPRCHPDCKSKVLLESLCASCHAINECLKCDPDLDKYFVEEELETSHWPCDKCLDVLKSIKMFWKIIIERVFGINMSKNVESIESDRTDSLKSVAKLWENEIVQQALFVKNVSSLLSKSLNKSNHNFEKQTPEKKVTPTRIPRPCKPIPKDPSMIFKLNKTRSPTVTHSIISQRTRSGDTGRSSCSFSKNYSRSTRKRLHRCTSARIRMVDVACSCELDKNNDEPISYKRNVEYLQQKCARQENEIEKLKRESVSLKHELQNFHKTNPHLKSHPIESASSNCDIAALIPKPFESCIEEGATDVFNNADSEMIITMRNCKNETFKHVSLLQVLHKTNEPLGTDLPINMSGNKKENPIELLTKVQNTFGEIVKREIRIVCSQKNSTKHHINATVCKLNNSKSAPSCSTLCTGSDSSGSNFMTGSE